MLLTMRRSLWFAEQSLPEFPSQNAGKSEMEHQRLSSQNACDCHRSSGPKTMQDGFQGLSVRNGTCCSLHRCQNLPFDVQLSQGSLR